jgi:hypothetical protein
MTLDGRRFIRKTAVRKASSQNFNGIDAWAKMVSPTLTMCLCFRSAAPFVDGHGGKILDGRCQGIEKKNGEIDIPHPNLIEQQESFY